MVLGQGRRLDPRDRAPDQDVRVAPAAPAMPGVGRLPRSQGPPEDRTAVTRVGDDDVAASYDCGERAGPHAAHGTKADLEGGPDAAEEVAVDALKGPRERCADLLRVVAVRNVLQLRRNSRCELILDEVGALPAAVPVDDRREEHVLAEAGHKVAVLDGVVCGKFKGRRRLYECATEVRKRLPDRALQGRRRSRCETRQG